MNAAYRDGACLGSQRYSLTEKARSELAARCDKMKLELSVLATDTAFKAEQIGASSVFCALLQARVGMNIDLIPSSCMVILGRALKKIGSTLEERVGCNSGIESNASNVHRN